MRIREPFNGASHLVGLLLAGAGTVLLLHLAHSPAQWVAFAIYGATLILLYGASAMYHTLPVGERPLGALGPLDHIAFFFLIAATSPPGPPPPLKGVFGGSLPTPVGLTPR